MAYELNLALSQSGLSLSALLVADGSVIKTIELTERDATGAYSNAVDIGAITAGKYGVEFRDGSGKLWGVGDVELDGDGNEVLLGGVLGDTGTTPLTITMKDDDGTPLAGVALTLTTDEGGRLPVARLVTDASGVAVTHLRAGTYWRWASASGQVFDNPKQVVVG
jgi:hypothetical protein